MLSVRVSRLCCGFHPTSTLFGLISDNQDLIRAFIVANALQRVQQGDDGHTSGSIDIIEFLPVLTIPQVRIKQNLGRSFSYLNYSSLDACQTDTSQKVSQDVWLVHVGGRVIPVASRAFATSCAIKRES